MWRLGPNFTRCQRRRGLQRAAEWIRSRLDFGISNIHLHVIVMKQFEGSEEAKPT